MFERLKELVTKFTDVVDFKNTIFGTDFTDETQVRALFKSFVEWLGVAVKATPNIFDNLLYYALTSVVSYDITWNFIWTTFLSRKTSPESLEGCCSNMELLAADVIDLMEGIKNDR